MPQAIRGGSIADRELFKKEALLTQVVFDGLQAVLGVEQCDLQKFIARFDVSESRTNSSGGDGVGERLSTLDNSPPTGTIAALAPVHSLKGFPAEQVASFTKKDEFAECKKQYAAKMMPIKELIQVAKKRLPSVAERKKTKKSVEEGGKFKQVASQSGSCAELEGLEGV